MRLDEVADIISGVPFRSKIKHSDDGEFLVVQMKDLLGRGVDWGGVVRTNVKSVNGERCLQLGDTLLVARGDRNRAAYIDHVPGSGLCSPHFYIVRAKSSSTLNPIFLNWYLGQKPAQSYFKRNAQGSGVLSVSREVVEGLSVPSIVIEEQNKIASYISSVFKHQEALYKLIENDQTIMDGLAQSLAKNELR
ncbi:MAG: restriction endonuclease S subunit [Flavobacteriales bacterium]